MRKTIYVGVASLLFVATMAFFACNNGQGGNKGGNGTTEKGKNGNQNTPNNPSQPNNPSNPSGTKVPEHIKLKFDKNKMTCKNDRGAVIESESEVKLGDVCVFTATLAAGRAVDKWAVNGQDRINGNSFRYHVNAEDAKSANPIIITYKDKEQKKIKVEFEASKISFSYDEPDGHGGSSPHYVDSGDEITEGLQYNLQTKIGAVESGKMIEQWLKNDKPFKDSYGRSGMDVYFSESDSDSTGKIKISFETKNPEEVIVKFDESKMKCETGPGQTLSSGTKLKEGQYRGSLTFEATKITSGKRIICWTVNGKAETGFEENKYFNFTIDARKKDSKGEVHIDFQEE